MNQDTRFNNNASTFVEALEYFENRAKQLLRHDYFITSLKRFKGGASLFFIKNGKRYQSIYILAPYRNKGLYAKQVVDTILTSTDCGIADYLHAHEIDCVVENLSPFHEYDIIARHYKYQKANRSQVPYMNHIDEGLAILHWINASDEAKKAYCLHPIYQSDADLKSAFNQIELLQIDQKVLILAMEYRNIANAYLSPRNIDTSYDIQLSPLKDVNDMLIADKIQNRKDFELYHKNNHPRSKELTQYFNNWLERLGVSESDYKRYKEMLMVFGK